MAQPNNKVPAYIEQRRAGLKPMDAALAVGYSMTNIRATASRLESRADVMAGLRKRGVGKSSVSELSEEGHDLAARLNPWKLKAHYDNPLSLMLDVMNNPKAPSGLRIACAKDAMPYVHARKEGTKREEATERAKKTAGKTSTFGTMAPPIRRVA